MYDVMHSPVRESQTHERFKRKLLIRTKHKFALLSPNKHILNNKNMLFICFKF